MNRGPVDTLVLFAVVEFGERRFVALPPADDAAEALFSEARSRVPPWAAVVVASESDHRGTKREDWI